MEQGYILKDLNGKRYPDRMAHIVVTGMSANRKLYDEVDVKDTQSTFHCLTSDATIAVSKGGFSTGECWIYGKAQTTIDNGMRALNSFIRGVGLGLEAKFD